MIYGGNVLFDLTADFLTAYGELASELPNEASIEPNIFVDENGNRLANIEVVYAGNHAAGEKAMAPLLKLAKPRAVELGAMPYRDFQTGADAILGHGKHYYLKSGLLTEREPKTVGLDRRSREAVVTPRQQRRRNGEANNKPCPDIIGWRLISNRCKVSERKREDPEREYIDQHRHRRVFVTTQRAGRADLNAVGDLEYRRHQ